MQMPCGVCGKPVEVEMAQPKILNMESVTVVIIEHSSQTMCGCGAIVRPVVGGIPGLAVACAPVPQAERKLVVVPGLSKN